jgi:hypothetical protein
VDLDNRLRAALDRALVDVRAAAEAEVDEVRQSAELSTAALRASAGRLSDCIHAVDEAPTLGSVLTVLAGCARLEAGRGGIVLVANGMLTAYPSRAEVPPDQVRLAASAAEQRTPVVESDAAAFPILVGGQVAAVLSTGAPSSAEAHQALDVLVRHAGRVLEGMTLSQIIGLTPSPAPSPGASGESAL